MTQFSHGDHINCYLGSSCTQFTCCMDDLVLLRTVDVQVTLDSCNFNLHLQIEKRSVDISLLGYNWGKNKFQFIQCNLIFFVIKEIK